MQGAGWEARESEEGRGGEVSPRVSPTRLGAGGNPFCSLKMHIVPTSDSLSRLPSPSLSSCAVARSLHPLSFPATNNNNNNLIFWQALSAASPRNHSWRAPWSEKHDAGRDDGQVHHQLPPPQQPQPTLPLSMAAVPFF